MQTCPKCGGSMSPKQTPKGQVFECDQTNGTCLNAKGYPNSVWPKTGGRAPAPQAAPQRSFTQQNSDDRSNRIERQHSQEMAIRTVALLMTNGLISTADEMKTKLKELTDYYQRDVGKMPLAMPRSIDVPEDIPTTQGEEVF